MVGTSVGEDARTMKVIYLYKCAVNNTGVLNAVRTLSSGKGRYVVDGKILLSNLPRNCGLY
jgi:hypothetical protein